MEKLGRRDGGSLYRKIQHFEDAVQQVGEIIRVSSIICQYFLRRSG